MAFRTLTRPSDTELCPITQTAGPCPIAVRSASDAALGAYLSELARGLAANLSKP